MEEDVGGVAVSGGRRGARGEGLKPGEAVGLDLEAPEGVGVGSGLGGRYLVGVVEEMPPKTSIWS